MKKLIDKNGRLFGLISLIDVAVIAIAAVLVAATMAKNSASPIVNIAAPMDTITYELTVSNMPIGRLDSLREGDQLFDKETKTPLGTITNIEKQACEISFLDVHGKFSYVTIKDRYNVIITVEAPAITDERQHTYVNRTALVALGWSLNVNTQACTFSGLITGLEK